MIEITTNNSSFLAVLTPNRSMTWEQNKKVLAAMFAVSLVIGLSFVALGAWPILPFAGLEILLVGIGMYYVSWKLNFQETIRIEGDALHIQKGVHYPKYHWRWQASHTQLIKQASRYRLSAPTLFLKHLNERIEIGDFLTKKEKKQLCQALSSHGIHLVTISRPKK